MIVYRPSGVQIVNHANVETMVYAIPAHMARDDVVVILGGLARVAMYVTTATKAKSVIYAKQVMRAKNANTVQEDMTAKSVMFVLQDGANGKTTLIYSHMS